jgi:hypothetical protein
MNAISGIFVALAMVFGGGYALHEIYIVTKTAAVERIQRGMPPLSRFTNRLTCSKFSPSGNFVQTKCGRHVKARR